MTQAVTSYGARGREVLRGAGAVLALLVLVIVVPVVLLVLAPPFVPVLPSSRESLWHALLSADEGGLLVAIAVIAAWVSWGVLTCCVLLEVVSVARGVPTPRLPVLGSPQRAASQLVAAVVVLLSAPTTTAGATVPSLSTVSAVSAERVAPAGSASTLATVAATSRADGAAPAADRVAPPARTSPRAHPTIVVRRHDTLWGLAERHLGSGLRYTEIVRLNRGAPQPDGRVLRDPHWIYPGWVLRLPHDASGPGLHRDDVAHGAHGDRRPDRSRPVVRVPQPPDAGVDRGVPAAGRVAPVPLERPTAAPSTAVAPTAVPPASGPDVRDALPPAADPPKTSAQGLGDPDEPAAPLLALGLGAVTIAGVLAEVNRQRRAAQRHRRPGAAVPAPSASAAAAHHALRAVDSVTVPSRLRAGLALVADGCAAAGQVLPRIALVRVSVQELELVLAAPAAPVPPFVARADDVWVWDGRVTETPPRPDRVDVAPALLSVGSEGPYQVLVNLEAAGTIGIGGRGRPSADEVVRALELDLRTRAAQGGLSVRQADSADRAAATAAGQVRREEVRALLEPGGAPDVHDARSVGLADEAWSPEVTVGPGAPTDATPWSGAASVVVDHDTSTAWSMTPTSGPEWLLSPAGISVQPQRLSGSDAAAVEELLHPVTLPPPRAARSAPLLELLLGGVTAERLAADVLDRLRDVTLPAGPAAPGAPQVQVLGAVHVTGADDAAIPGRVGRATELVAFLALHPGCGRHAVDEAMWPGRRVERSTRNPFVSRARQWLGRAADGRPYLPLVADGGDYRLSDDIGCDWYDFVRAVRAALAPEPDVAALRSALGLVRGRPFQGVDAKGYAWADALVASMVAVLVDVTHLLACLQIGRGAAREAGELLVRGLAVEPAAEQLHRDAIAAAGVAGDPDGVDRAVRRLERSLELLDLGDDLEPDTYAVIARVRRDVT